MDPIRAVVEGALRNAPVYFKMGALLLLMLILLIPIGMVEDLVYERQHRRDRVVDDIAESWGRAQTLFGPILVVPFRAAEEIANDRGRKTLRTRTFLAHFLPETLAIDAHAAPEVR